MSSLFHPFWACRPERRGFHCLKQVFADTRNHWLTISLPDFLSCGKLSSVAITSVLDTKNLKSNIKHASGNFTGDVEHVVCVNFCWTGVNVTSDKETYIDFHSVKSFYSFDQMWRDLCVFFPVHSSSVVITWSRFYGGKHTRISTQFWPRCGSVKPWSAVLYFIETICVEMLAFFGNENNPRLVLYLFQSISL